MNHSELRDELLRGALSSAKVDLARSFLGHRSGVNVMARLGRYTVSAGLLSALMALPCVCSASAAYEEPSQFCHDLAESAYRVAVARGDGLPDSAYDLAEGDCADTAWRAFLIASPDHPLSELIAFDADHELTVNN